MVKPDPIVDSMMPPPDPKKVLLEMEHGVFDAILALSAAIEKGMINGFLVFPSTNGCGVELIFPPKPDAPEDAPNPSRKVESASPAGAIAMAGEIMNQMLMLENQNHGNHQDYVATKMRHRDLRTSLIIKASILPGKN